MCAVDAITIKVLLFIVTGHDLHCFCADLFQNHFLPCSTVCVAVSLKCLMVYKVTFSLKSTLNFFDNKLFKLLKLSNLSSTHTANQLRYSVSSLP
jgi:hypothetical protein